MFVFQESLLLTGHICCWDLGIEVSISQLNKHSEHPAQDCVV